MRIVTYNMPYLFGSGVGIAYSLDRDDKLDLIVGTADYPWAAISLVERMLIEQGTPIDHSKYYLSVDNDQYKLPIADSHFEKTLALLRWLGLSSWAIRNGGVEMYPVYTHVIKTAELKPRRDCPKLAPPYEKPSEITEKL